MSRDEDERQIVPSCASSRSQKPSRTIDASGAVDVEACGAADVERRRRAMNHAVVREQQVTRRVCGSGLRSAGSLAFSARPGRVALARESARSVGRSVGRVRVTVVVAVARPDTSTPRGMSGNSGLRICPAPRNPRGERVLAGLLNEYGQRLGVPAFGVSLSLPCVAAYVWLPPAATDAARPRSRAGAAPCPRAWHPRPRPTSPSPCCCTAPVPAYSPVHRCAAPFVYGSRTPFPGFRRPARPPLPANKIYRGVTAWSFLSLAVPPPAG